MSSNGRPNNFCYAPWSTLEILPDGSILPCCKFVDHYYQEQFNITKDSVKDYQGSKKLWNIKQEFLAGQWPAGCERCKIDEENSIPSKRQMDYQRWQTHYDNYDLETGTLLNLSMALGNTCNLKCVICNPKASSLWRQEWKQIFNIDVPNIEKVRRGMIHDIVAENPDIVHIDLHGGEPFLSNFEDHRALLDGYIQSGRSKEVSIHYTTNATIYPSEEWFERWSHFKEIDMQISIDAVGKRYEYMRFPGKWSTLVDIVSRYVQREKQTANLRLSVAHVVTAHNVFYIDEFVQWCQQVGLPNPWLSKIHRPHYLRPTVWPQKAREFIIAELQKSNWPEINNWISVMQNIDESHWFDEFRSKVAAHDVYRGQNFEDVFPELAEFFRS